MSTPGKQYGLILAKKKETHVMASKPSVFESDSDEEEKRKPLKNPYSKQPQLKTQLEIQKVLEEDPNAYEYDSVYDAMKEKKEAELSECTVDKKPKYIQTLLKAADKRKKEYERRVERKIQKEREEEGEKFADKEAFVTTAYKKKMQELQEEEEKEKRMDAIEALMDVTKQKDLSGFYRHLLKKQTSPEESSELKEKEIKKEKSSSSDDEIKSNPAPEVSPGKGSSSSTALPESNSSQNKARDALKHLRKGDDESKKSSNTVDADSDFSSDSESSSSDSIDSDIQSKESKGKQQSDNGRKRKLKPTSISNKIEDNEYGKCSRRESKDENDKSESSSDSDDASDHDSSKNKCVKPVLSDKEKLKALFAKRTVGDAFISAQERYWQRIAQRTAKPVATSA